MNSFAKLFLKCVCSKLLRKALVSCLCGSRPGKKSQVYQWKPKKMSSLRGSKQVLSFEQQELFSLNAGLTHKRMPFPGATFLTLLEPGRPCKWISKCLQEFVSRGTASSYFSRSNNYHCQPDPTVWQQDFQRQPGWKGITLLPSSRSNGLKWLSDLPCRHCT